MSLFPKVLWPFDVTLSVRPWLRISPYSYLNVIYCLIITAWQWLMRFMYIHCIPMQTKPNKSPLRKRLKALLLWPPFLPLQIRSWQTYSYQRRVEGLFSGAHPPTVVGSFWVCDRDDRAGCRAHLPDSTIPDLKRHLIQQDYILVVPMLRSHRVAMTLLLKPIV